MEVAMGEYQTDADPMDALRAHLEAIRAESARRDPKTRSVAGLIEAREQLAHRLEPFPERIAALSSRVTAKLEEMGGTLQSPREPESADDSSCAVYLDLACAAYQIGDDSTNFDDAAFCYSFGESAVDQYSECIGG
jgi:hypothetical protein